MNHDRVGALTDTGGRGEEPHFFRVWMPYLFQRIEHPARRHVFLPLNRDYQPLGHIGRSSADYAACAETHGVWFARDPSRLESIWHNVRGGQLWLYDDSAASRLDYFERLEKLMSKAIRTVALR